MPAHYLPKGNPARVPLVLRGSRSTGHQVDDFAGCTGVISGRCQALTVPHLYPSFERLCHKWSSVTVTMGLFSCVRKSRMAFSGEAGPWVLGSCGVDVNRSACWSYVTWYNELTGNWVTWEPGDRVEPGTVGFFDRQRRFTHYRTLADYGIKPRISATELPGRSRLVWSDGDVHLNVKASGQSPAGFEALGAPDAGLKVTAKREHACMLHMRDLSEAWITDMDAVLRQIQELLLKGEWEIDSVVVARRTEVRRGFAAVSLGSGQSFEARADSGAHLADAAALGHADFTLASGRGSGSFLVYDFGPGSTPVFTSAIRVRRGLWGRLLPWRSDGGVLIDPDGRTYRGLPGNLSDHALEARRYDPARSLIPPGELSAIAVGDLFEEVIDPGDEQDAMESPAGGGQGSAVSRLLSFPLPAPPGPSALAAADLAEGAPPVSEAASPDGLARFALFDRGDGEYWLEVSPDGSVQVPVIVRLRYTAAERQHRELLVPIGGGGTPPSSVVALPGYDRGPWHAWVPVPFACLWSGPPDLVQESVRAALTSATVRIWEQLASVVPEYGRSLIIRAIETMGGEL